MTQNKTTMTDAEAEALADKVEHMDSDEVFTSQRRMVSVPMAHFLAARQAQEHADQMMVDAVAELREDGKLSWEGIGQLLGITGEGARKRYAKLADEPKKRSRARTGTPARSAVSGRTAPKRTRKSA